MAGESAERAAAARRKWKTEKARAALGAEFASRGRHLIGEWCDFDESTRLSEGAERLGPAPDRMIQRWPTKQRLVEALEAGESSLRRLGDVYVLVLDVPDAEWIRIRGEAVSADLAHAAGEWLTDGFIVFLPWVASLLSVDVEEQGGVSFIETTLIGEGFGELRAYFAEIGPESQEIVRPNGLNSN
ncbi:hypothetical protein ACWEF6_15115 [Amycolatopsis sp. NPDC004772]